MKLEPKGSSLLDDFDPQTDSQIQQKDQEINNLRQSIAKFETENKGT
jgi:hypothetical protein